MKRIEILLINKSKLPIKKNSKYAVTQLTNENDALVAFQAFKYNFVVFDSNYQNQDVIKAIDNLIKSQSRKTSLLMVDNVDSLDKELLKIYKQQNTLKKTNSKMINA